MRSSFWSCLVLGGWVLAASVQAQVPVPQREPEARPFDFHGRGPYRGVLPRPEALLGYEPGEWYADHAGLERLLAAYAAKSDRMKLFSLGRTNERREMSLVAVSSPRNIARLDEIRANNLRLADPASRVDAVALDRLIAAQPVIVWLAYNIHGDEAAGTEAAMQVLYQLLDGDDPVLAKALEHVVVLINPCQNPDGRARFVTWAGAHGRGRAEPFAYEKSNPWNVQGRLNHFYFDLNRDMLVASQVESRHAMQAYLAWMPQVVADHHGETAEYFFPPAALPINSNLPREDVIRWLERFGRGNAAAFDRQGWLYYVRDIFDVFYPGYWDSWPSLQGATGMTYETSGGGKLGQINRREDGTIDTLRDAIAKHFTASLATVETSAANREERLRDFRRFFVESVEAGRSGDVRQFIFPPVRDAGRQAALIDVLVRNGVEVKRVNGAFEVKGARDYFGGEPRPRKFPAGTMIVDLAQARGRIARALLEVDTRPEPEFLARQEERRARNEKRGENVGKEGYEFYDMTGWSLPLAFGVEAYWSGEAPVTGEIVRTAGIGAVAPPVGAKTAYMFEPDTEGALRLALRLLADGYRVAYAERALEVADGRLMPGTFVALVARNPSSLHTRIAELAVTERVRVASIDSAYAETGNTGVGSESIAPLATPRVLLLADDPVEPESFGSLDYVLTQTYGADVVPVSLDGLEDVRLSDFNILILPHGGADDYAHAIDDDLEERLKSWVREGGSLIALGGAALWAAEGKRELTAARLLGAKKKKEKETQPAADTDDPIAAADGKPEAKKPLTVPGALLRADVNHDSHLAFGYGAEVLPVFISGDSFLMASDTGTNVLTFGEGDLRLSGHIWRDDTAEKLRGTATVIDEPLGKGRVVLFTDEPGYRQIVHTTTRMLINAVLFGPSAREGAGYAKAK